LAVSNTNTSSLNLLEYSTLSSVRLFDRGRHSRRVLPLHWHQAFAKVKKQSKERQKSQQFKTGRLYRS
jgi:hypothetical protein